MFSVPCSATRCESSAAVLCDRGQCGGQSVCAARPRCRGGHVPREEQLGPDAATSALANPQSPRPAMRPDVRLQAFVSK